MSANRLSAEEKIINAFLSLMEKHRFSSIKTVDIIKKAEISRQTFYRLFEDKYQLAREICWQNFIKYASIYGENATWKEISLCYLHIIKTNGAFYSNLINDPEGCQLYVSVGSKFSLSSTGHTLSDITSYAWVVIITEWSANHYNDPVEDICHRLLYYLPVGDIMADKDIEDILNNYSNMSLSDMKNREIWHF